MSESQCAIAITGAGGAGVISCGELLLKARARQGGHGFLRKAFGPQIRGGEAAALLKLTDREHYTPARAYQVLVALDWVNFTRFGDEIAVDGDTLVICPTGKAVPEAVAALAPERWELDFPALALDAHPDGRENMLVAGLLGTMLGLSTEVLCELAVQRLAGKPEAYREAAVACIRRGAQFTHPNAPAAPAVMAGSHWCLTGNQAAAYGALRAGVRFAAAYPITPASDALETLAGGLEAVGGQLVQAEDELAAINMAIGAAFGGVPAFTATSGPGLALMAESIGLAVASETPVVILNVMRGGPSTGIPTKSEQSDLDIALHGLHGDAPHLVLAPLDVADCATTTGWAVGLAARLQTAAIVLSDQFLGQSLTVVSEPGPAPVAAAALDSGTPADTGYLRYRLTESGVSTLAFPGEADHRFTADGLEHNERGTPSAGDGDHRRQLDKRRRKLETADYGPDWGRVQGEGPVALLGFGSAWAALAEAAAMLQEQGVATRLICLRLLAPLRREALLQSLAGCEQAVVVEQNHGGQLHRYLRGEMDFEQPLYSYARPGPVPLDARRIAQYVSEVTQS